MNARILLIILLILVVGFVAYALLRPRAEAPTEPGPATFEECAAKYPVMESYPRRCVTPDGQQFVESGTPAPEAPSVTGIPNLITVTAPVKDQRITSPLTLTGQARGTWYFEASFPIDIRNSAGVVIAQGHGEAQGDWMTEGFVPFKATVTFPAQPTGSTGTVVLHKDNPSGDPARDQSVAIPVTF